MAEAVQFHPEESVSELETVLHLLFEKHEVQTLSSMRKEHEYKMIRSKNTEDCMKYIQFEIKLMKIIKSQQRKKGVKNAKLANLDYTLGKRLDKIFIVSIRRFPEDCRLWVAYINFCSLMQCGTAGSRILEQMLELHGSENPKLYKIAATFELEKCNSTDKARRYLLMGIHAHKDNKVLLTEAFKLELIDADRKRKECLENNIPIDATNAQLTSKKAECVYKGSIKKLMDVELLNQLIDICSEYDFASELKNTITSDLFKLDTNERMWDIVATRELHMNPDGKLSPKARIGKCVQLYETAVERLNTEKMWAYYIDALTTLCDDKTELPNYKKKLLLAALQKAATAGKLDEKYYLLWVSFLEDPDKHKRLVEVLQGAVKNLPDSVTLWRTLLRVHLIKGEEKQASQVFDQGVAALTSNSLPLWKLMMQFEQTKRNNKVEEIFKKSWNQCPEISGPLKPMYLEWLVLSQGISAARKAYDVMVEKPHPCLEMHKKMVYLETIQPVINKRRIRQTYTIATAQFGLSNIEVWMDYSKFEISSGDSERVSEIYWRARNNLSPQLLETFLSEFSLVQAIPDNIE